MNLYRCHHCGAEFEADRPRCEPCGIDPQKDPRTARFIQKLETVHFDPPSKFRGLGQGHAACNPALKVGLQATHATGEPAAVTCRRCQATDTWKAADAGPAEPAPGQDFPVVIDQSGTVTRG